MTKPIKTTLLFSLFILLGLPFNAAAQVDADADGIELNIFPNPNRGDFYITVVNKENYKSQLYSADGKVVRTIFLSEGLNYITLDNPPGIYFLKVGEGEEQERFKIVIK